MPRADAPQTIGITRRSDTLMRQAISLRLPPVARAALHRVPGPHSTSWVLAETAASAGFSLLSLLLIGRVIGPHEAGIGAVAIAAFLLLDVLGAAMFPDALVQRPGLGVRHVRSALTASVLVGLAGAVVLVAAAPLAVAGTGQAALLWLMLALAPLLPLSAFSGTASGTAMREQRFRLLALRVLLIQPVALVAGLAAAAAGLGAWAIVANQAVATVLVFLLFLTFGRLPLRPALDRAALGELWPVAGPQIAAVVLMIGRYRIFLLLLGLLLAEAALAQAHFAFRLLEAALTVVRSALSRIAMPRFCALQQDRAALARSFGEASELAPLLGLPIAIGVALVAHDLVAALLGPAWAGMGDAARIVGLAAAVGFLHGDQFSLFVALGRARWNMIAAVANLAVPLLALLILRPETPAGAALAWSTQSLVVTPVLAAVVLRQLGRSPLWLLKRAAPGLVAGAAMVPAVLLVQEAMAEAAPLPRLLAGIAAGGVVFLTVAWLALGRRRPAMLAAQPEARAQGAPPPEARRPAPALAEAQIPERLG
ncbi:MAG TPA: oligosaccharide flippase family protein [Falsiroseomonas sp.]|jgi:PST family polysaccharide transporter|nr:oligosaccharide flippase family protein [Falsiroseomonas sp.]